MLHIALSNASLAYMQDVIDVDVIILQILHLVYKAVIYSVFLIGKNNSSKEYELVFFGKVPMS